jgi:proline iminopeptidase
MKPKHALLAAIFAGIVFAGCEKELDPKKPGMLVPKTVDQDSTLPSIGVNGTRLHAQTFGNRDSAIIIVMHGGPGGDYRSLLNCKAFADNGYFVVFYDQRGTGLSRRHSKDSYSIRVMLDDLSAIIRHYRRSASQKVFLLGHSWGAMLAAAYINDNPTEINGVVLAEPGGLTWQDAREYMKRTNDKGFLSESVTDAIYFDQIFTGGEEDHEMLDYKMQLRTAYENESGNSTGNSGYYPFWRSGAVAAKALLEKAQKDGFNWTTNLHRFIPPVLFVYSELNRAYGLSHAQLVSGAFHRVRLERINGSGHRLIYSGWNQFYPLALTYFNQLK